MEVMFGEEEMHTNGLPSFDSFVDPAIVHEEGHVSRRARALHKVLQRGLINRGLANCYPGKFSI